MWKLFNLFLVVCVIVESNRAESDCVSNEPTCGPNEFYNTCKKDCPPETCATLTAGVYNCDEDDSCKSACACKPDFLREEEGSPCIPANECPQLANATDSDCETTEPTCEENEVFETCHVSCPPETCISLVIKFYCVEDQPCEAVCACKRGYLRKDKDSPCIPFKECPQMANLPDSDSN